NRVIYYLIPLGFGSVLFAGNEICRQRKHIKYIANIYDKVIAPLAPQFFAIMAFLGGIILLFSTATPSLHHRLMALDEFVPVPVIEISHFIGSIIGIALLFLARGLQKRLDSAYYMTILLMMAGILVSLLKGFDYEESLLLCIMLLVLIPSHRHFYRKTSLLNQPFTPMWILSIFIALVSTVWLGFFSYKHITYSKDLWWTFSLHGDAPRFLRELAGLAGFLVIFSVMRFMRMYAPEQKEQPDMQTVRNVLKSSDRTDVNLALLGDKRFFFNDARTAMIMYGIEGRSWIAMGDPIGNDEDIVELTWQFREYCDRHGGRPVFYEVSTKHLELFLDMGLTLTKIGETAKINLDVFDMEAPGHKRHRRTIKVVEQDGCSFEMLTLEQVSSAISQLQTVSDFWLKQKHAKEKGFSLGFFSPGYISQFPVAVVKKENEIIAFANIWTTETKKEMSVDLMRYIQGKSESVMEYLFLQLILWGKENGYHRFDLGMAPLSGLYNRALAPLWHRLGAMIFQFGNPVYRLQGLRQYKEKFDPVWEPMYIASPGGLALPEILINLSALISGGYKRAIKA
ncbi:MAG TPA: bifunctional lysylphosphatidylglycerol flippase/synthetase MprF, partial [Candidatus Cloacimonadota bacterium]|nr:bifunctional lysylphosphatidylglycerol flippase/synthetase MprF [Candidatus Cloacimonadota bacterium]